MSKSTKKSTESTVSAPVLSKAAKRKIEQVDAICAVRANKRVGMDQENLMALVEKLDRKILMSKQAAMIQAFHEVEVEDAI